jgi:aldose sugar dehydrogenase
MRRIRNVLWMSVVAACSLLPVRSHAQVPLPDGPGKSTVQAVCSQCHGLDAVTSSGRSRNEWQTIVREMVEQGAQIPPDQIAVIVDYLARHFREGMPSASAPAANTCTWGGGSWTCPNAEFRLSVVTRELAYPWGMAFLPNGDMLVTERNAGRLRVIRNGVLDPQPVAGLLPIYSSRQSGLLDIALHPRFAENQFVYLAYSKPQPDLPAGATRLRTILPTVLPRERPDIATGGSGKTKTNAVMRGRWDGKALRDVQDIFVSNDVIDDSVSQTSAQRLVFGRDGMLYMSTGAPNAPALSGKYAKSKGGRAQDPMSHGGKVLRLRDDGTVPPDNPFVGRAGYLPELYTLGHRNVLGLTVHPATGEIWEHENGPLDGDEVNILKPGRNYGWPITGMGRDYSGDFIGGPGAIGPEAGRADAQNYYLPGFEQPFLFWAPAVSPSGMTFYTADRFPQWKGNLFIGVQKYRRLERHMFNQHGQPVRREYLLEDLKERIRDVRQGPDGLLYLLTDANPGSLLRLEPVQPAP